MTQAELAAALRALERDLMIFGAVDLDLGDAEMITLSTWWSDQLLHLADEHLAIATAALDAAGG